MTTLPADASPAPPSGKRLAIAAVAALAVAALVLVTAVLPAEFGIDPLGAGKALGLLDLYAATEEAPPPRPTDSGAAPVQPRTYKTESTTFTLKPSQAFEYKYRLEEGLGMVYAWQAAGPIKFEFHSEPDDSSLKVRSHEKGESDHEAGSLLAPYTGIHGWYWENPGQSDVTLTLTSAGFYTAGEEMRPKWDPAKHKMRVEHTPHELSDVSK
jgi:hypothetical protein